MAAGRYRFEPLGAHHDRAAFSSGVEALDRYFRHHAGQDARRKVATVFVLHDAESSLVVGYYTLSSTAFDSALLPLDVIKKLPRYPILPAVLLGRLAVDARYRGQGFGRRLLLDALQRALAHTDQVAAMGVIVDAKDDAARRFDESFGFQRFADNPSRLYISMPSIARL